MLFVMTFPLSYDPFKNMKLRSLCIAAALMFGVLSSSVCAAQPVLSSEYKLTSSYAAPRAQSHWYGWQTLTADVASVALTAFGVYIAAEDPGSSAGWGIIAAGLISFTAITPLVHLGHGNLWMLGSVLLRAAAMATMIAGTINLVRCIADNPCWGDASVPLFLAGPALAAVTTVLDAIFAVERRRSTALTFAPWADPRLAAGGLNLVGRW